MSGLWSHLGSNQGPPDYESGALTNWAIGPALLRTFQWKEGAILLHILKQYKKNPQLVQHKEKAISRTLQALLQWLTKFY